MKNSMTIVLPKWFTILQELEVAEWMMPHNVRTTITSNHDMKLRQYKLSEDDWDMGCQLHDVLKVCNYFLNMS